MTSRKYSCSDPKSGSKPGVYSIRESGSGVRPAEWTVFRHVTDSGQLAQKKIRGGFESMMEAKSYLLGEFWVVNECKTQSHDA